MSVQDALDRFRKPEYTGENRCMPCTAVNLVLAIGLALAVQVAVLVTDGSAVLAALASALVFALAMAAIALRGYLVPGTPWITRTYFPAWVLRKFDKGPAGNSSVRSPPGDSDIAPDAEFSDEEIEATLARLGAVTECDEVFRTDWQDRAVSLRPVGDERSTDLQDDLAAMIDGEPDGISVTDHGEAWSARVDGRRVGQWESHAAVLADVAAANALRERHPETWADLSVTQRGQLLKGLRVFVEQCPACDGVVRLEEETVESCCRSVEVVAVACQGCGDRLFEAEKPGG
jgi:hypothetical protein